MTRYKRIVRILENTFSPDYLEVVDETSLHIGHRESRGNKETHFKITIFSEELRTKPLLEQHRAVYKALETELSSGLHALTIHTNSSPFEPQS